MPANLKLGNTILDLAIPRVMGILNVTPDSFSDGGSFTAIDSAMQQVQRMVAAGADIIDVGGESTRPGAASVSVQEELDRTIPVIEKIVSSIDVPVSIDTSKPEVMHAAVRSGAHMINDVCALQGDGALQAAAELAVPVCLMHMQGEPRTMQQNPQYDDVVADVKQFLLARVAACNDAGIGSGNIVLDPGFGFGKTITHNFQLLAGLGELAACGMPVLAGMSRKSMFGNLLGRDLDQRLPASLAAGVIALMHGASILRVHDVPETVDAVKVFLAVRDGA
jgi:dihydropteroate synthase